ncbi:MAG: 5'-3' exonuclease H3TH domain-containing protein [Sandaracinaceae bacterium]
MGRAAALHRGPARAHGGQGRQRPRRPGHGQKGAAKLIETYGDLDGILAHLDDLKGKQKKVLTDHQDDARLSRDLVTIRQDVELPTTIEALQIPDP